MECKYSLSACFGTWSAAVGLHTFIAFLTEVQQGLQEMLTSLLAQPKPRMLNQQPYDMSTRERGESMPTLHVTILRAEKLLGGQSTVTHVLQIDLDMHKAQQQALWNSVTLFQIVRSLMFSKLR